MISIEELYRVQDLSQIDQDAMIALHELHFKLNFLRRMTTFPWIITSGFRTPEEQLEIYQKLNKPAPMGSAHLLGYAVDISDPKGDFKRWILDRLSLVESLFLFFEDFDSCPGWVHLQCIPYPGWEYGMSHFFKP